MENDPQKSIARNEPKKWNYLYSIVGLNRILDTSQRELNHELRWTTSNGVQPIWRIAKFNIDASLGRMIWRAKSTGGTHASDWSPLNKGMTPKRIAPGPANRVTTKTKTQGSHATDRRSQIELNPLNPWFPAITRNHSRSPGITRDPPASLAITRNPSRSPNITRDPPASPGIRARCGNLKS
jgi:hypothetical protein